MVVRRIGWVAIAPVVLLALVVALRPWRRDTVHTEFEFSMVWSVPPVGPEQYAEEVERFMRAAGMEDRNGDGLLWSHRCMGGFRSDLTLRVAIPEDRAQFADLLQCGRVDEGLEGAVRLPLRGTVVFERRGGLFRRDIFRELDLRLRRLEERCAARIISNAASGSEGRGSDGRRDIQ